MVQSHGASGRDLFIVIFLLHFCLCHRTKNILNWFFFLFIMDLSDYDQQYDGYVTVMTPDCLCELLDEIGVYHVHFILFYFVFF